MRNQLVIVVAILLVISVTLWLSDIPGVPDVLLDAALLMLVGAALVLSGWIRSTMFR